MCNDFEIVKFKNICIVYTHSTYAIDNIRTTITKKLIEHKYQGKVVFDLLIPNGLEDNRFVEIDFNKQFEFNSKIIKPNKKILNISKEYFSSKKDLILKSQLCSLEKKEILKMYC